MSRPLSQDLRERVTLFMLGGATSREAASRFGVSVASAVRWMQRRRRTGDVLPDRIGGRRPLVLRGERDWLLARLAEKPDLTLRAIRAELADRGVVVSYDAVWRFYRREGQTFKKSLHAAEQDRPDVPGSGRDGNAISIGSTRTVSSSWTRPGPRPT